MPVAERSAELFMMEEIKKESDTKSDTF